MSRSDSIRTALLSDEIPICRICMEETEPREMVRPCRCSGTQQYIHRSCAVKWLRASNKKKCDLCQTSYVVLGSKLRSWNQWSWPKPLSEEFEDQIDFTCCWLWLIFNLRIFYALLTIGFTEMHFELCRTFASHRIAYIWWMSLFFNMVYYSVRITELYDKWIDDNSDYEWKFQFSDRESNQPDHQ
ncbi:RING-CH-type domain-containing protein [Aphelenchoides besseyi]|nr:RING-CH-type domain-containing protein [Aphelenchoides besseyi]KAI6194675.1 RING-CH-type domain-containing protein [Aphelenchoides besseyi]